MKDILRKLRVEAGLSQGDMAKVLNISKSAVSMYENGRRRPDYELLEKFADYFNVDMEYLWGKSKIRRRGTAEEEEIIDNDSVMLYRLDVEGLTKLEIKYLKKELDIVAQYLLWKTRNNRG